jgi:hypothetical protein
MMSQELLRSWMGNISISDLWYAFHPHFHTEFSSNVTAFSIIVSDCSFNTLSPFTRPHYVHPYLPINKHYMEAEILPQSPRLSTLNGTLDTDTTVFQSSAQFLGFMDPLTYLRSSGYITSTLCKRYASRHRISRPVRPPRCVLGQT